ncbi:deoxynucleoside kinase [Mesorhizobium sp. M0142]|uniref:dTMP kinase n=1 Tax=Mesorhizobium sp. M0142 TaxID=2956894 RepID=UPI003334D4B6
MPSKPLSPRAGYLLTIEGADGVGKSTQLARLRERLHHAGNQVSTYDFPNKSGTPIGELIGSFLRGAYGEVEPEFLALAFAADRMTQRGKILNQLAEGFTIICDRYVASNVAFQSAKVSDIDRRRRLEAMISWFEFEILKLPKPDLQIVLIAPDEHFSGGNHLQRSHDQSRQYIETADIHEARVDLQLAVNSYYRSLTPSQSLRLINIQEGEHRLSETALANRIWEVLTEMGLDVPRTDSKLDI